MMLFQLFIEFLKIGLFAIGGGLAAIPFLEHLSSSTGWFPLSLISEMIAISEATPGPLGIKMATYVGFTVAGWAGGLVATLGVILPAIIIVTIASKSLDKLKGHKLMDHAFYGLRPAVIGLITGATFTIMQTSFIHLDLIGNLSSIYDVIDITKSIYFLVLLICIKKFKKHPVFYIAISAVVGIIFRF